MYRFPGAMLALCLIFLCSTSAAGAIEFSISGEYMAGVGLANAELMSKKKLPGWASARHVDDKERFGAKQNFKIQLEAEASESLAGLVFFEIEQSWGKASDGAALGADGTKQIRLKNAWLEWSPPAFGLKTRMGLQTLKLPSAAGGSAIMGTDVAAIVLSYPFNDVLGVTAFWMRPVNDNFHSGYFEAGTNEGAGYLDNMDLFMAGLPARFDGIELTPWLMAGMMGKNSLRGLQEINYNEPWRTSSGNLALTIPGLNPGINFAYGKTPFNSRTNSAPYGSLFWLGFPVIVDLLEPWRLELDVNYGHASGIGRYNVIKRGNPHDIVRGSTERSGWLFKALIEYQLDWATPGLMGWYATGDDGNLKNGSERMPSLAGAGNFTSFVGDGNLAWGAGPGNICDWNLSYAGTWGIGLQLKDLSFLDDFEQTFRAVYWGGTNSPAMVKYMENASSWANGFGGDGPYLTTNDGLVEFNLVNRLKIYENLEANLELGYVINLIDNSTWQRSAYYDGKGNGTFSKQDAWKAQLAFLFTF